MSVSWSIVSGKGGVGKSSFTANIGAALVHYGHSVVIIDTDIGLRSQDSLLGLENSVIYDLIDVAHHKCSLDQALLNCPSVSGLFLLPASQFARARSLESSRLKDIIWSLKSSFDFILVDSPAGIEKGFRNVINAGTDESILILTPDDLCVRDAERTALIIQKKNLPRPFLVVNRIDPELVQRKEMVSAQTLSITLDLPLIGEIPEDAAVYRSILRHSLYLNYDCEARRAVLRIAKRMMGENIPLPELGKKPLPFFRRFFSRSMKEVTPIDNY